MNKIKETINNINDNEIHNKFVIAYREMEKIINRMIEENPEDEIANKLCEYYDEMKNAFHEEEHLNSLRGQYIRDLERKILDSVV